MMRLEVKYINATPWMNAKSLKLVEKFNNSDNKVYLDVFNSYQDRDLETILDEGMYDISFEREDELTAEIIKMLNEAEDHACFVYWDLEDIDLVKRELDTMPVDHIFPVYRDEELCHSTGFEVKLGDEWWNEYVDSYGDFHYGR